MLLKVTRPEMDLQHANLFEICTHHPDTTNRKTSMDILEINNNLLVYEDKVEWKENLDHDEVLNYLENVKNEKLKLTVFFIAIEWNEDIKNHVSQVNPQTMVKLQNIYNLSTAFVQQLTFPNISPMHYNYFTNRNAQGDVIGIEGTYFCDTMSSMEVPLVHFVYDFLAESAVYFTSRYPRSLAKEWLKDYKLTNFHTVYY
ncbi:hypothetical protein BDQ17DRAFT_1428490 [Cyathus striatus]|nr:hypothetical protein BDQ17DRAFT_1428490 [Cyathus striatus]